VPRCHTSSSLLIVNGVESKYGLAAPGEQVVAHSNSAGQVDAFSVKERACATRDNASFGDVAWTCWQYDFFQYTQ